MKVDFPTGVSGVEKLPKTRRALQNCHNDGKGNVLSIPGISLLNTTGKVARGNFEWNGSLYQVVSNELIKITNKVTGAFSVIGTIAGPEPIETAIGFNTVAIVARGGASYSLDKSDVLTNTSGNSNFVPFSDVTHIDGRFVYTPADGTPAKFSDIGAAGTIQPLSFFDAEKLPDNNKAVANFRDTLLIFGENSIEQFRDTGASPNPFTNIPGGRIKHGYIGGLINADDTILFIGREEGQDRGIYALSQGAGKKISNEFIDTILATYTIAELAEAIPGRFKWNGHDIATFTLRRDSFGFSKGQWFLLDTVFSGVSRPWAGGYIAQFEGEYFTAFEGKIGKLNDVSTNYGERITRIIDMAFQQENDDFFTCQSIELGISQGFNSAVGSVALMMTRDGVLYGPAVYRELGAIGQYQNKLVWNPMGGLGNYPGFMGFRFYTTENVEFSADSVRVNLR